MNTTCEITAYSREWHRFVCIGSINPDIDPKVCSVRK